MTGGVEPEARAQRSPAPSKSESEASTPGSSSASSVIACTTPWTTRASVAPMSIDSRPEKAARKGDRLVDAHPHRVAVTEVGTDVGAQAVEYLRLDAPPEGLGVDEQAVHIEDHGAKRRRRGGH